MHPLNQYRTPFLLIVLACVGLLPIAQAVTPAPDGGYANANTAEGSNALFSLTTGVRNTANGYLALRFNTTGQFNTAVGSQALDGNTTGEANTATGIMALSHNTTGERNIGVGANAGLNLTTGDDNIDIGNAGTPGESDTIRIGTKGIQDRAFIAGIFGTQVVGTPVAVNSVGQLGVAGISSLRFKDEVKPMDKTSEAILALKPVTFHYKKEIDPKGTAQFGLVAEDVEKVDPALITRDAKGKPFTVRYEAVNAMLLNEFLKEHRKVEEQQATITELKSGMEALTAMVKEQASQIQKVNARLEMSKPAPQVAENSQ